MGYISGCDAILLGAETLRGLYPVETISTVGKICSEVSALGNYHLKIFLLLVIFYITCNLLVLVIDIFLNFFLGWLGWL